MAKKQKPKFEQALSNLESIVENLESGNLSLDESITKFEEGLNYYKSCKSLLLEAEKKITVLSESMKEEEYGDTP